MFVFEIIAVNFLFTSIPYYIKKYKIYFPYEVYLLFSIHIILALSFGSVLDFYSLISWWDLLLHGFFGFIFCCFFLIICKFSNYKANRFIILFISLLCALGLAGAWEIWEFSMDSLLNLDSKRIEESIANNHSPVYDTMWDIIITAIGGLIFILIKLVFNNSNKEESMNH